MSKGATGPTQLTINIFLVKNRDTAADTREAVPDPTISSAEGTVRTKNKGIVPTVKSKGNVPLDMGGEKPI